MAVNTIGAGVILNEGQIDVDFRVEGNSATHTLFVEGETDRVGIGTSDPDGKLHIHTATAGSVSASTIADDLVIENSDHCGISILTPADKVGVIYFGDVNDNDAAQIFYDHDNQRMGFATGAAVNAMFIDSNQRLGVGTSAPSNDFVVSNGGANGMEFGAGASTSTIDVFNRSTSSYTPLGISTTGVTISPQGTSAIGLLIDQDNNKTAFKIDSESTTLNCLTVEADALTTGSAGYFYSANDRTEDFPLVE